MADPLDPLAILGPTALTEGVKFLYNQAGELLKRLRERRDAGNVDAVSEPIEVSGDSTERLAGELAPLEVDFGTLSRVEGQLHDLHGALQAYAEGSRRVHVNDRQLLEVADALRQCLEAVYQQRITFRGEQRPPSGPAVEGRIDVDKVAGYAAAVRVRHLVRGQVSGEARAKQVGRGSELVGVEVDKLGGQP